MRIGETIQFTYQLVVIAGGLAAFVVWARGGVKWLRDKVAKIEFIAKELTPNGGGSLKDTLNMVNGRVLALEHSQADQTQRLQRIENRLDAAGVK